MLNNHIKTRGITLIELMIAMVISLVLLLGVGSIYFNSKRTYLVQEEFAHMQESARMAMRFMIEDIRMAGYMGCAWNNNLDYGSFLASAGSTADNAAMENFPVGLEGLEASASGPGTTVDLSGTPTAGWNVAVPGFITNVPLPGSDIMIVRHADGNGAKQVINNTKDNLWLAGATGLTTTSGNTCHGATGICEGDLLLVTDCLKSRLFQVTTGMTPDSGGVKISHAGTSTPGPGNSVTDWSTASGNFEFEVGDSALFRAVAYAYYVANNTSTPPVPSLFRQELRPGSAPEELIEGVENMQILYGIDTNKTAATQTGDGIANQYATADLVTTSTDNVVSARISLLLATSNAVSTKTSAAAVSKNFILSGMTAATGTTIKSPADRRIRKVFTTTVKIRNKGIQPP